ncbi:polysaccharide deacetylase family protein [Actinoallomurus purpureus]|uniref:polysaccharide deacetylase family protein n=1 Tax=Actinoallomurus purpureus TaxID=478114 RepID=UPI002093678A|nr:polysaccharide deacetylase family protein [Actinoallomurus purpureus]MCO6008901.1 polysaccharide deacetylase family protein [Actinoallomurus purpureus]
MRFVVPSETVRKGAAIAGAVLGLGWLSGLGAHTAASTRLPPPALGRPAPHLAAGWPAPPAGPLRSRPADGSPAAPTTHDLAARLRYTSWPRGAATASAARPEVDCRKAKCIALTFDDGPGPYTTKLLGMLAAHHVKATFFLIGGSIRGREAVVRRELAEGHAIGDHTWSHPQLSVLSDGAIRSQLTRTLGEIRRATGGGTALMRPPYGATNRRVAVVTRHMGFAQILWSVDTNDWRDRNSAIVAHRAVSWARPGGIILMHDIHPTTVNAVPKILAGLARRGFTFVTVPELFGGRSLKPGQTYFDGPVPRPKNPRKDVAPRPKGPGASPHAAAGTPVSTTGGAPPGR